MAFNLYCRNETVEVPIAARKQLRNSDQMGHRCIGRFADITLMMKLLPEFVPSILAGLDSAQRIRRIIWRLVTACESVPAWVVQW